jgi:hypothetical protein
MSVNYQLLYKMIENDKTREELVQKFSLGEFKEYLVEQDVCTEDDKIPPLIELLFSVNENVVDLKLEVVGQFYEKCILYSKIDNTPSKKMMYVNELKEYYTNLKLNHFLKKLKVISKKIDNEDVLSSILDIVFTKEKDEKTISEKQFYYILNLCGDKLFRKCLKKSNLTQLLLKEKTCELIAHFYYTHRNGVSRDGEDIYVLNNDHGRLSVNSKKIKINEKYIYKNIESKNVTYVENDERYIHDNKCLLLNESIRKKSFRKIQLNTPLEKLTSLAKKPTISILINNGRIVGGEDLFAKDVFMRDHFVSETINNLMSLQYCTELIVEKINDDANVLVLYYVLD